MNVCLRRFFSMRRRNSRKARYSVLGGTQEISVKISIGEDHDRWEWVRMRGKLIRPSTSASHRASPSRRPRHSQTFSASSSISTSTFHSHSPSPLHFILFTPPPPPHPPSQHNCWPLVLLLLLLRNIRFHSYNGFTITNALSLFSSESLWYCFWSSRDASWRIYNHKLASEHLSLL